MGCLRFFIYAGNEPKSISDLGVSSPPFAKLICMSAVNCNSIHTACEINVAFYRWVLYSNL